MARQAAREDTSQYGALLGRLISGSLATRYYTRWLGRISNYLAA